MRLNSTFQVRRNSRINKPNFKQKSKKVVQPNNRKANLPLHLSKGKIKKHSNKLPDNNILIICRCMLVKSRQGICKIFQPITINS